MTAIPEHLANPDMSVARFGGGAGDLPARARVVVIGAGIIGSSVAYHLSKLGWTDVVVLERHALTSGTSWHAAGLVSQVRGSHAMTAIAQLNVPLDTVPGNTPLPGSHSVTVTTRLNCWPAHQPFWQTNNAIHVPQGSMATARA